MFEELTEKPITDLVILISVDNEEPQIFTQKRDEWISKFMEARDEFKSRHGY